MKLRFSLALVGLLAGCASAPKEGPFPDTIAPRCTMGVDCTAKWDAAKEFVERNAEMKISISSSDLIETDVPPSFGPEIGMRVTKQPVSKGVYKLVAAAFCSNLKCRREPWMVVAAFNLQISAIKPKEQALQSAE